MTPFQRIVPFLITIYAVLYVSAAPLVAVRVSEPPRPLGAVISSEHDDRVSKTLTAMTPAQHWHVVLIVLVLPHA